MKKRKTLRVIEEISQSIAQIVFCAACFMFADLYGYAKGHEYVVGIAFLAGAFYQCACDIYCDWRANSG
jgi:peroxiredoxin family protein